MSGRFASLLFTLLVVASSTTSCTTTIRPPASISEPATVYLLQHGISSSLVLNSGQGSATRWAYGDWRYYALGKDRWTDALAAVLRPTQGALGRQRITPAPMSREEVLARIGFGVDKVFPITVERQAVVRLQQQLDALFVANIATRVDSPEAHLEFVHHPQRYSLFRSSNRKVAQWLRALGCETDGFTLRSWWRVDDSPRSKGS